MFDRLRKGNRKEVITDEQLKRKEEAVQLQEEVKQELTEAREINLTLRNIRLKNHFAEGFRRSLGGTGGH